MSSREAGFTLIELVIVVAIIAILAAVAVPLFGNMVAKAQEGSTKGNLGSIRSAFSLYYADNEGVYPSPGAGFDPLLQNGHYLKSIPTAFFPGTPNSAGHPTSNQVTSVQSQPQNLGTTVATADLSNGIGGGWVLVFNFNGDAYQDPIAMAECGHSDLKGTPWTAY